MTIGECFGHADSVEVVRCLLQKHAPRPMEDAILGDSRSKKKQEEIERQQNDGWQQVWQCALLVLFDCFI